MALLMITSRILEGRPIDARNHGQMWRNFTDIIDLVRGIGLLIG